MVMGSSREDVEILPADRKLLNKLGGAKLDAILSSQAVQKADEVLSNAADDLYLDCVSESVKLQALAAQFQNPDNRRAKLGKIVSVAFRIKNKSSQGGYDLIATLAESLQIRGETCLGDPDQSVVRVILWHVQSIAQLLALKVKADGGEVGKAILAEVQKLRA
jgi:hypothetical protein